MVQSDVDDGELHVIMPLYAGYFGSMKHAPLAIVSEKLTLPAQLAVSYPCMYTIYLEGDEVGFIAEGWVGVKVGA